jgi:hypothetical protein
MLNALDVEQQADLEQLRLAFINQFVVQDYFQAQAELAALCQVLGDALSASIGLKSATACGVSCCG